MPDTKEVKGPSTLRIHLRLDPKPIATSAFDWEGWVEGMEEQTTVTAPLLKDCLERVSARLLEVLDIEYRKEN